MIGKKTAVTLAALGLFACLDRQYNNPFISSTGSDVSENWKRDRDGNGIADSVEAYAPGCMDSPAECLHKALLQSRLASTQPGKNGKDASPADSQKISRNPADTVPVNALPKDTVHDTVIVNPPSVAVTGIHAEAVYIPMGVPQMVPSVSVLPQGAKNQEYTLASGDESIVKVSGTALIPVKPGTAVIKARSDEGGFTSDFDATVILKDTNRYEEQVSVADMDLTVGDPPKAPVIQWTPVDVTNRGYALASSDTTLVHVVGGGGLPECLAVAAGDATLTLKTQGKGLVAFFHVRVKPAPVLTVPVQTISAQDMTLDLGVADQPPAVSYSPSNSANKAFTLTSAQPGIAAVSGHMVHAVGGGKALITIVSADGPSSTFNVTVHVHVASVSAADIVLNLKNTTMQPVIPVFLPPDADDQAFTLKSDNPAVVSIQGNEVQAVQEGSAVIQITAEDGGKTGTFTVTVAKKPGNGNNGGN